MSRANRILLLIAAWGFALLAVALFGHGLFHFLRGLGRRDFVEFKDGSAEFFLCYAALNFAGVTWRLTWRTPEKP